MDNIWDCVIVGGGAAGLSAALVLGRARRRVLLVDAGDQSNLAAHGIGGLLASDGRPPAELYSAGRAELAAYPTVEVRTGEVVTGEPGFVLELADGTRERARTVLLATGMEYRPPNIAGLEALWGDSVFHCPFCHGWEMRDAPVAVIAQGDRAVHSALMMRGWTEDLMVLTNGDSGLDDAQVKALDAAGIGIDERLIAQFVADDGELAAVEFTDGARLARRGALVAATLHQRSLLATHLGAVSAPGPIAVDALVVDAFARTSVPGLFAAGDLGAQMPQVATAVASGSQAGAAVVQYLLGEDVGLPVPPWPAQTAVTAQYWERHYGQRGRIWSGRVNAQLAKIAADLPAGRALDLGCGEGGDSVWLAEQGWQVTGVDVSDTALARALAEAQDRGVADRTTFERHDLSESIPDGGFDLVSAQFLQSPIAMDRAEVLRRAAGAVADGGLLVIVDHGAAPPWAPEHVRRFPFPSADEVVDSLNLDATQWERVRVGTDEREATGPDGQPGTLIDNVMVLRRRG
ncbi:bifunctional NAD(P)/FAD-dependent oxidoreductase/class I SAM-dependent methyltransferase [Mycolicibacterium lutetiense]|uniref:Thioredoxin reductase/SAM-dependent methyltransferase n=1 Tax=Mycolicibacterium lutetiense TaxID=1641992 RepID=A0ABS4ZQM1_9MYCO|nr:bifunctional NAD(P)/FAD-dependent oxidoreductase/class I SAM-dependent methyltransferase [Mycolicibacterium lutetiense]MBP2451448.1 thioredoxin reductase/SAM-dependent methyltransferase [Mycolicibacterium lutetiense]